MVLRAGGSVVVEDDASLLDALPELRGSGSRSLVASPVWMGGWLCAVLVAGGRGSGSPSRQEVEAIEMVAGQLGMALENVQRYQQERDTVEHLGELDRLKSDFLSTVSHELRSPVTVIKGVGLTLERAWEDVDEAVRREMIAGLNANATLLEGLIANLLDLSRLAGSGAEVRFEPFELSETLLRTAGRFRRQFPSHGLRDSVPPGLVARADPLLIERAVENLLSNVAKHTPPGTTGRLVGRAEANDIVVEVSDDGPGVDEAAVPHLGERFFRAGDINTRPKGLGLGLALVREILDLHGSMLEVENQPGHGLRVWFRLAADRPEPSPDPRTTPGSILLDAR
jgi:two-component system sensor histidine kinase KdpD